jgi:hypothetical protein
MKIMIKTIVFCFISFMVATWFINQNNEGRLVPPTIDTLGSTMTASIAIDKTSPPCLQMYYCIEKYAREYDIPLDYAYGIAYCETRYEGPFDWDYDQAQGSSAGAVGPMQIMPQYADPYIDEEGWTRNDLMTDIEMNVKVSMRMLRKLKNIHGDWLLVFGAYNTGRPMINDYARRVYNYKPKFKLNEQSI